MILQVEQIHPAHAERGKPPLCARVSPASPNRPLADFTRALIERAKNVLESTVLRRDSGRDVAALIVMSAPSFAHRAEALSHAGCGCTRYRAREFGRQTELSGH